MHPRGVGGGDAEVVERVRVVDVPSISMRSCRATILVYAMRLLPPCLCLATRRAADGCRESRGEPFDQLDVAALDGPLFGQRVEAGDELGACLVAPVGCGAGHRVGGVVVTPSPARSATSSRPARRSGTGRPAPRTDPSSTASGACRRSRRTASPVRPVTSSRRSSTASGIAVDHPERRVGALEVVEDAGVAARSRSSSAGRYPTFAITCRG